MKHFLSIIFLIAISLFSKNVSALAFEAQPVASIVETNQVSIEWMADEPAEATLFYGKDVNFLSSQTHSKTSKFHRVRLQNLLPHTQYYFKITLKNTKGLTLHTPVYSFKTKLELPPLHPLFIKQPQFDTHGEITKIFWQTNVPTLGTLHYGTDTNLKESRAVLILQETHEMDLKDLKPQTKYYFKVEIENASGAKKMSHLFEGWAPKQIKKPVKLELELSPTVSQITRGSAVLEIILSQQAPITIYYGKSKNLNEKKESLLNLKKHRIQFENLEPNQVYYYKITAQEKSLSPVYEFRTNFY